MAEMDKKLQEIKQRFQEQEERLSAEMDESTSRKRATRDSETDEPDTIPDSLEQNETDKPIDLTNHTKKRAKVLNKGRTDDNQPPSDNPSSSDVIPSSLDEADSELNTTDINKLLDAYKINQSKAVKVEHHILFLEQSLKECKIPKGLQWNKDYHVIDETADFKTHIRQIHMNAEIEICQAILDHYKERFDILCKKSKAFTNRMEELAPENPELQTKTPEVDKPIKELKEKLVQKRKKKLTDIQTHLQRSETYITKKREPRQPLNQRRQNNNRPQHQQPTSSRREHATRGTPTYHRETPPMPRQVHFDLPPRNPPPRARTADLNTEPDRNTINDLITRTIQQMIFQMSPYFHQPHYPRMNSYY